ncbi:MAG: hypothetical protein J5I93_01125 [Pirellulaceae bacterium]|nr:hypothetical protein [Pirellulaceae bacterium]
MLFTRRSVFGRLYALLLLQLISTIMPGAAFGEPKPFGLEQRIPWRSSRITGSPGPPKPYRVARVFPKLQFVRPVTLTAAPGTNRLFLVELDGKVFSFPLSDDCRQADLCVDLAAEITGLQRVYGLTFHPDFADNRSCYICYVLAETKEGWVHSGLLLERSEQRVVLRDATNKEIRIAADQLELLVPQQKSLMPELLLSELTAEQTADLIEYLRSLR